MTDDNLLEEKCSFAASIRIIHNVKSKPGDERAKARWDAFEVLETARKSYDASRERLETSRRAVTSAQCDVASAVTRLQSARDAFERLQALDAEDEAALKSKREANPFEWPAPYPEPPHGVRVE